MEPKILKLILPLGLGGLGLYLLYLLFGEKFNFELSKIGPEWSGVIAVVFLIVVGYVVVTSIRHSSNRGTETASQELDLNKVSDNKVASEESIPETFSELTVKDIISKINSVPEYQKEAMESQFNGIWVKWKGNFYRIEKSWKNEKLCTVRVHTDEDWNQINWKPRHIANVGLSLVTQLSTW